MRCLLIILSLLFAINGFADESIARSELVSAATPPNVYHDAAKTIVLTKENKQIIIEQKANPTTGYSWFTVSYPSNLLSLDKQVFIAPKTSMPGKPGVTRWYFTVNPTIFNASYVGEIKLLYAKPWEIGQALVKQKPLIFYVITQATTE
ncbi:MAG: protease inhibitor I42 family protein [Legionellales bacterium]|nr:protease inhibitor I42 family protein [Legionellales bacterium]